MRSLLPSIFQVLDNGLKRTYTTCPPPLPSPSTCYAQQTIATASHSCIYTRVTQRSVYTLRTLCVSSSQVAIHRAPSIDRATDRYSYSLLTRLCLRAIKPDAGRFVDGHGFFLFLFSFPLGRKPV